MKRTLKLLIVACIALALFGSAFDLRTTAAEEPPQLQEFRATLLQSNEVPPVPFTGASGSAWMVLDRSRTTDNFSYEISVRGIPEATAAHIHQGMVGVNGGVVFDLLDGATLDPDTVITGTLTLTQAQITQLTNGDYYINVHTAAHPAGELRGQIYPRSNLRTFAAFLSGANEAPPVETEGVGLAIVRVSDTGGRFDYEVLVEGIENVTGAHIHEGPRGANGPVLFDLLEGGLTLTPTTILTGTKPIGTSPPDMLPKLLAGNLYVNVHTEDFPDGELRGQLVPSDMHVFAGLTGENQLPPVTTLGSGIARFHVDVASGRTEFRVHVHNIESIVQTRIYRGGATIVGDPIIDLLELGGGVLTPNQPLSGAFTLAETNDVLDMLKGGYYVNVQTIRHNTGEIRGQTRIEAGRIYMPIVSTP